MLAAFQGTCYHCGHDHSTNDLFGVIHELETLKAKLLASEAEITRLRAIIEQDNVDTVKIPTSIEEARAMAILGTNYLEQYAPNELHPPKDSTEFKDEGDAVKCSKEYFANVEKLVLKDSTEPALDDCPLCKGIGKTGEPPMNCQWCKGERQLRKHNIYSTEPASKDSVKRDAELAKGAIVLEKVIEHLVDWGHFTVEDGKDAKKLQELLNAINDNSAPTTPKGE